MSSPTRFHTPLGTDGRLGRERSFLLVDAGAKVKLPSDLAGLTTLHYQSTDKDKVTRTVGKACDDVRGRI